MSRNKSSTPLLSDIARKRKEQDRHQVSWFRGRHRVVMLTNKEYVLAFSSASDQLTWTDIDCTLQSDGITATSISEDTIAVILLMSLRDTGSAATTCYLQARVNGSADDPGQLVVRGGHINSMTNYESGIVGVDTDKKIEYKRDSTGASTATGDIAIIGYIEQIS